MWSKVRAIPWPISGPSLRINGTVRMSDALGGDVIVAGIVEGDVACLAGR